MRQRVVKVSGAGMVLFSRVLAHELRRGDLIVPEDLVAGQAWWVLSAVRWTGPEADREQIWLSCREPGPPVLAIDLNIPVWRAVGCGTGGLR